MGYFKDAAKRVYTKIHDVKIDNKNVTGEQIERIIYLALKEVARDQRYKCIENLAKHINDAVSVYNALPILSSNVHNADLGD